MIGTARRSAATSHAWFPFRKPWQPTRPNFFIEAVTVADGRVHSETREVIVPPEKRVLNVEVLPSATEYKPGQKATVKVRLTDLNGKPFVGSTAMSIYDKSVEYSPLLFDVLEVEVHALQDVLRHHRRQEAIERLLGAAVRGDLALLLRRHGLTDPWRIGHARRWCPLRYVLFDLLYHRGRDPARSGRRQDDGPRTAGTLRHVPGACRVFRIGTATRADGAGSLSSRAGRRPCRRRRLPGGFPGAGPASAGRQLARIAGRVAARRGSPRRSAGDGAARTRA